MAKRGAGIVKDMFKTGFGLFSGIMVAQMLFMLAGLAFFIPGFLMLKKEQKKPKAEQSLVLPYVLMGIGMVLGVGMGSGVFFDNLASNFS